MTWTVASQRPAWTAFGHRRERPDTSVGRSEAIFAALGHFAVPAPPNLGTRCCLPVQTELDNTDATNQ